MLYCNCISHPLPATQKDDPQLAHLDFLSAGKYLRKVALRVSDVPMKLGINRIIHFLTEFAVKSPSKLSFIDELDRQRNDKKKEPDSASRRSYQNKQNFTDMNEPESFVGIATSRSLLSEGESNVPHHPFPFPVPMPTPTSGSSSPLSKGLQFRQVVTKFSLDAQPTTPRHVRFVSSIRSQVEEEDYQIIDRLEAENKNLENCLKNLFAFFQQKHLLSYGNSLQDIEQDRYGEIVEQLTCNFIDYTKEIQQKINNLSAKSSLLQETIHNMSISLRIDKDKDEMPNKVVQTDPLPEAALIEELQKELNETAEASRKGEILAYIKDEEIADLKVIISDLQNRLKTQKDQEPPMSKSYMKFFQATGQNLSRSTQ